MTSVPSFVRRLLEENKLSASRSRSGINLLVSAKCDSKGGASFRVESTENQG